MSKYREEQVLGRRSEKNKHSKGKRAAKKKNALEEYDEIDHIEQRIKAGQKKMKAGKTTKKSGAKSIKALVFFMILNILCLSGSVFMMKVEDNGGGLSGALAAVIGHDNSTLENLDRLDVLIIGVSNGIDAKLSDTIMVASYDPKLQKASILSIPRDTFVGTSKNYATPNDKINAIYSYTQDPDKVLAAVNDLTGLNIENYLVVETEALVDIVDAVGGIEFDVPIDMKYDDPTQNLYIDLTAGYQLLSGRQAEWLVRFRKNNNGTSYPESYGSDDTGRMRTQREFLMAAAEQIMVAENITKIGTFVEILANNITTNMDVDMIKDYAPYAIDMNIDNIETQSLPGTNEYCNGTWIFVPDSSEIARIIDLMFNFKETTLEEQIAQTTVEIIDASGDTEYADSIVEKLLEAGYFATIVDESSSEKTTTIVNQNYITQEILQNIKSTIERDDAEISESNVMGNSTNDVQIVLTSK